MTIRRHTITSVLVLALVAGACSSGSDSATGEATAPAPTTTIAAATTTSGNPVEEATTTVAATPASAAPSDEVISTMLGLIAKRYLTAPDRWAGFEPGDHPSVVPFRSDGKVERAIAINHPDPDALGDATPIATEALPFTAHLIENLTDPAALESVDAFDFTSRQGGVSSFVMVADASDSFFDPTTDEYAATFIHEMFHRHQILSFDGQLSQDFENYAYTAENFALATLEDRALAAALTATADDERDLAARRFAALRLARRAAEPSVSDLDDSQEASEGTARWIEHATAPAGSRAAYVADNVEGDLRVDLTSIDEVKEHFAFGRFYASGAAVVELLDRLDVADFAERIQAGEAPATVLTDVVGVAPNDVDELVADARAAYDPLDELTEQATAAATAAEGELPVFSDDGETGNGSGGALTDAEVECLAGFGVDLDAEDVDVSDEAVEACLA